MQENKPVVAILMGSNSDWDVMKNAAEMLQSFDVPFEAKVVSAHRMPDEMFEYAETARDRGIRVIIAGAGGAAHLPGMLAAKTTLPVCGVPVPSRYLKGQDSLYSIVQMQLLPSERPALLTLHFMPSRFWVRRMPFWQISLRLSAKLRTKKPAT